MTRKKESGKMSYREFVENAIRTLRKPPYKGIHVVYSRFNETFELYYGEKPRPVIDQLEKEGFVVVRPAKRGATLFLASEYTDPLSAEDALQKIVGTNKQPVRSKKQ